jgi:hypothetical protein
MHACILFLELYAVDFNGDKLNMTIGNDAAKRNMASAETAAGQCRSMDLCARRA